MERECIEARDFIKIETGTCPVCQYTYRQKFHKVHLDFTLPSGVIMYLPKGMLEGSNEFEASLLSGFVSCPSCGVLLKSKKVLKEQYYSEEEFKHLSE